MQLLQSLVNFQIRHMLHSQYERRCVMREGRKIATRAIQIPTQTSDRNWMRCLARKAARRIPLIIRRVLRRVRKPLYRDTIPAGLMDRRWFKYHSSHSVLPRRWRMSLRRSSVFLISFFSPPSSCLLYAETTGRSGWTTLSRSWIRPFFPRIVDESIGHPAAFYPLFAATLSMYHGCRRAAGRSGLRSFVDDSWTRKRDSLVSILYPARICSCAILTIITITPRPPRRYIKNNIKLIRTVGYPLFIQNVLFIQNKK